MKCSFFFLGLLIVLAASSVAQEPSLADVARQKPKKKATVVITNDDIPSKTEREPLRPQRDPSSAAVSDRGSSLGRSTSERGSKSAGQIGELKAKINDLKGKEREYELSIQQLEEELKNANSDFRVQMYSGALENNRKSLNMITAQRKEAESQLSALQKSAAQDSKKPESGTN